MANYQPDPYSGQNVFWGEEPDEPSEDTPFQFQPIAPEQWQAAQQAYQNAALEAYNRMASGASSVANYQQAGGLGQVTGQAMGRSVGRGGDPLAMRQAMLGSAGMQGDAMRQASAQRAQEAYQAQRGYAGALSSNAQGQIEWQKMRAQQQEAAARQWAQMAGVQASNDAATGDLTKQYVGAAAGAAGAAGAYGGSS